MEEIIRVENLTHTYGEGTPFCRSAVQDMSLAIYRGEFLGIIGHTGSGKSTLIQHLNGLLKPTGGRVLLDGAPLELTETEFSILHCLAENRGRVVPVRTIYETVWHETYMPASNNTVMVHIVNLRKKLEEDPANPRLIRTVWGKGYQID